MLQRFRKLLFGYALQAGNHDALQIGHVDPTPAGLCSAPPDDDPPGGGGGGKGDRGDDDKGGDLSQATIDAVNAAVRSQIGRLPLGQMVGDAVKSSFGNVTEQLNKHFDAKFAKIDEALKGIQGSKGGSKGGDGKSSGEIPEEVQNALDKMTAKVDELTHQVSEKDQQLQAQREQARERDRRSTLRDALSEAGVPDKRLTPLVAYFEQQKKIQDGENGEFFVEVERDTAGHRYKEKLKPTEWAKEWIQTDEGKEWLPAQKVGGGGRETDSDRRYGTGIGGAKVPLTQDGHIDKDAMDDSIGEMVIQSFTGGGMDE